ncbi:MAG: DUF1343 domain-containing protein [Marinifilaceae bacterium]|jgi:uncharacterized protein YbbC (DUF1343 family)|nr:DUF1343 domain-containing protein [Marinifilaceae bacterium]
MLRFIIITISFILISNNKNTKTIDFKSDRYTENISVGAENTDKYLDLLKHKNVAVVANQSSLIFNKHIVDFLIEKEINLKHIFSPEHGFRGNLDAGKKFNNQIDEKTGLKIISLYGKNIKPQKKDLANIDVLLFDLQDVGVRFYTYITCLHYVMMACAENNIDLIVLDRPNNHADYIDGPILKSRYKSYVGIHPVPIIYGLTIGEYAKMINGENWLGHQLYCNLEVIECKNYYRDQLYNYPIKPSPNLPNNLSIGLYPSLCLFEGTTVSAGRGTNIAFQVYGHPKFDKGDIYFTPNSIKNVCTNPKFKGKKCLGFNLSELDEYEVFNYKKLNIKYLINAYKNIGIKTKFFNSFFNNLAGNSELKQSIILERTESEIRESWKTELENYSKIREKYLIYKRSRDIK